MKRILFFILTFSLIFCLSIPCFAEENNTYNYNGHELLDVTDTARDYLPGENGYEGGKTGLYCWILHNPTSNVYYFYTSNTNIVFDSEENTLSYEDQGFIDIYNLTKTDVLPVHSQSVGQNTIIDLDTSYLVWSSHTVRYRDNNNSSVNNQVYMQGDLNVQPDSFTYGDSLRLEVGSAGSSTVTTDTVPYVFNAVNVLLIAGVSILAFFVVLKLFCRRTLLFR